MRPAAGCRHRLLCTQAMRASAVSRQRCVEARRASARRSASGDAARGRGAGSSMSSTCAARQGFLTHCKLRPTNYKKNNSKQLITRRTRVHPNDLSKHITERNDNMAAAFIRPPDATFYNNCMPWATIPSTRSAKRRPLYSLRK